MEGCLADDGGTLVVTQTEPESCAGYVLIQPSTFSELKASADWWAIDTADVYALLSAALLAFAIAYSWKFLVRFILNR